ncbi:MAG: hypothetical protein IJ365_05800, partial [Clostridia bacterium]|nr:hypothetical protein [Clostridia bacterium]
AASSLTTGTWNRISAIFTGTSEDATAGTVTGTLKVYINGTPVSTNESAVVKDRIIRFIVNAVTKSIFGRVYKCSVPEIYVDNISMTAGDIDTPPAPIGAGYSVSGAYLTLSGSPTVATFISNLTLTRKGYTVKVYNASGAELANNETVTTGMTAKIYDGNTFVNQYYIK